MQLGVHAGDPASVPADLLVVGVFSDELAKHPLVKELDRALSGALLEAVADEDFKGRADQRLTLSTHKRLRSKRVALVGMGARKTLTASTLVGLGGNATRAGNGVGAKHVALALPRDVEIDGDLLALVARGAHLGAYRFDRYLSDKGRKASVGKLTVVPDATAKSKATKAPLERAAVISRAVALARDLVNEPGIELYPESFAARARAYAKEFGLGVKVFDDAQLAKMGMNLLLAVGMGSAHKPRLVHLSYVPKKAKKQAPVVLVGKGITFDSGGLCLKPPDGMMDMKVDMGGAAAVVATMTALAQLQADVEVHGILTLAENMPSGTSYRLGDVIKSAAGRTVEINNTDAEGRLVLADAITYARNSLKPRRIIDLATLTGACVVALGPYTVGLFSNDDPMAGEVLDAARRAGEDFWRMPLNAALKEQLKSDIADTKNTGERYGGAITAALFLSEFIGEVPWCHLDIAGPVTTKKDVGALTKGATGVGVATLVELLGG